MSAREGRLAELRATREAIMAAYRRCLRGEITAAQAERAARRLFDRAFPEGERGLERRLARLRAELERAEAELAEAELAEAELAGMAPAGRAGG